MPASDTLRDNPKAAILAAAAKRRAQFVARDAITAAFLEYGMAGRAPAPAPAPAAPPPAPVLDIPKPGRPRTWRGRFRAARRLKERREALLASGLFDARWYLERYPDVAAAGVDPLKHFLYDGSYEGRAPGPDFDTLAYLADHPDVVAARIEPWLHYARFGKAEGRITKSA